MTTTDETFGEAVISSLREYLASKPAQYEYRREYGFNDDKMNEWGADGWRLVAIDNDLANSDNSIYVFMREKPPIA